MMNNAIIGRTGIAVCASASLAISALTASALDLVVNGAPEVSGKGSRLTARYANVATVDGKSVDLVAEITAQEPATVTHRFSHSGNDFVFGLEQGRVGETYAATVLYSLFESGTSNPIVADALDLTIDDLDGSDGIQETIATSHSSGYVLESATGVLANDSSAFAAFRGSGDRDSGDASAAVTLRFPGRASFEITYTAEYLDDNEEAVFRHDGNGDFAFDSPAASEPRVYLTYHFTNNSSTPVEVRFFDSLPSGLQWDATFEPDFRSTDTVDFGTMPWWLMLILNWLAERGLELKFKPDGSIAVDVNYTNGGQDAAIDRLILPPGNFDLKLCTRRTDVTGLVFNDATIVPSGESGVDPLTADATLALVGDGISAPQGGASDATTAVVDADADTSIAKNIPTWSGDTTQLYATADSDSPSQTLLYFDLADDLPEGALVESAALYLTSTDPHGTRGQFALHEILVDFEWTGGGFSWNAASDGLAADGRELGSSAIAQSENVLLIPGVSGSSDRKKWDITALVQKWASQPSKNHGMAILPAASERDIFCSREHLSDKVRPKLVVTWR